MEIDHQRTETSYVTILSLYLSVSSSPSSSLLYSFTRAPCLCVAHTLGLLSTVTDRLLSVCLSPALYFLCVGLNQTPKPYLRTFNEMFYSIFYSSPLHFCLLLFLPSSSSLFIQLKQCDLTVLMQHHANCQKSSGGLAPTLKFSTECNLAEDT